MRTVGDRAEGGRLRALIVLLWRAGLRISEALALQESDLDPSRGAILVRRGKGGKRREVGMDRWAWDQLGSWLEIRRGLPIGALLCVIQHANPGITRLGRGGARCRRYRRSVSPTRPPNRTCPFLSIRLSTGRAVADRDADVMQRRFPAEWRLGLFRCPPTARGCCGRDSDIGSLAPRRAMRASCLPGWSSCAPSTSA
jgi:integrase